MRACVYTGVSLRVCTSIPLVHRAKRSSLPTGAEIRLCFLPRNQFPRVFLCISVSPFFAHLHSREHTRVYTPFAYCRMHINFAYFRTYARVSACIRARGRAIPVTAVITFANNQRRELSDAKILF